MEEAGQRWLTDGSTHSLIGFFAELLSCPELHSILRLVLKAGNYMNAVSHDETSYSTVLFHQLTTVP